MPSVKRSSMLRSSPDLYLKIPMHLLSYVTLGLPLLGFIACILLSIIYDFKRSTATHCHVNNYLPSTSAAIGGFTPQVYIWRITVSLHTGVRYLIALAYYNFYTAILPTSHPELYKGLSALNTGLHIAENLALVGLTCISSIENHSVHEMCFITFMTTSLCYMLLSCILYHWARAGIMTDSERRSYWLKKVIFILNISSFFIAVYFYFRHNAYCEPGIYTMFSLLEYVTIITNILFHSTAILDFQACHFTLGHTSSLAKQR